MHKHLIKDFLHSSTSSLILSSASCTFKTSHRYIR